MAEKRMRLDKMLGRMGVGTRKEIRKLVKAGRVTVDGALAADPGMHVVPERNRIEVDGHPISYRENIYLMMNKPAGVVSATVDRSAETVIQLLEPQHALFQPFPVGRLDKDTEGLLLLTNDGKMAHRLLSPKHRVPKRYFALVEGEVTEAAVEAFRRGVILDDGYQALPAELIIRSAGPQSETEVIVYEGKYHQVKRMFKAVGKRVVYLKRIAMGPLQLDPSLEPGEYRELTEDEVALLSGKDIAG
ncbi:MAG: pseudouridine synthase [Planifilum sp.]|jgi:16S rRNA pseudouridine516 synthase